MKTDPRLAWVDIETTGLHHDSSLLEIALIITDEDLKEEQVYHEVFHIPSDIRLKDIHPDVLSMHSKNGLWRECSLVNSSVIKRTIPYDLEKYYGIRALSKMPLCGSSVHFDRAFLKRAWPELERLFHYRNFDTSTITRAFQMWLSPPDFEDILADPIKHRALDDIRHSIKLAKYYKKYIERIC